MLEALGLPRTRFGGRRALRPGAATDRADQASPEHARPAAAAAQSTTLLHDWRRIVRHDVVGAYLRLEVDGDGAGPLEKPTRAACRARRSSAWAGICKSSSRSARRRRLEQTYDIGDVTGTHGIGHTRLSTESRVDLSHSQPFWAHGVPDLATVHNGHITNYHKLRRVYEQRGYRFFTENDSEVIGIYLRDRMDRGRVAGGRACALAGRLRRLVHATWPPRGPPRVRQGPLRLQAAGGGGDRRVRGHRDRGDRPAAGARRFMARGAAPGTMRVWSVSQKAHAEKLKA